MKQGEPTDRHGGADKPRRRFFAQLLGATGLAMLAGKVATRKPGATTATSHDTSTLRVMIHPLAVPRTQKERSSHAR